jgi:hypothetical protein
MVLSWGTSWPVGGKRFSMARAAQSVRLITCESEWIVVFTVATNRACGTAESQDPTNKQNTLLSRLSVLCGPAMLLQACILVLNHKC